MYNWFCHFCYILEHVDSSEIISDVSFRFFKYILQIEDKRRDTSLWNDNELLPFIFRSYVVIFPRIMNNKFLQKILKTAQIFTIRSVRKSTSFSRKPFPSDSLFSKLNEHSQWWKWFREEGTNRKNQHGSTALTEMHCNSWKNKRKIKSIQY